MKSVFAEDGKLTVPALAVKPLWKTTQASTFLKRVIFSLSSRWMRMVPAMGRMAPEPTPQALVAARCGFNEPGVIGQAEIVVAGQVDDAAAVVMGRRGPAGRRGRGGAAGCLWRGDRRARRPGGRAEGGREPETWRMHLKEEA